jgi:excisionase family DNA binding protein
MFSFKELPDQLRLEIRKSDLEGFLRELLEGKAISASQPNNPDFQSTPKEILTVDEVAELTGLAKQTIYTNVCKRLIPHYKARRKVYFKRTEIIEWMLNDRRESKPEVSALAADFIEAQKLKRRKGGPNA